MDASVAQMWAEYLKTSGQLLTTPLPAAWHFCDNPIDADQCAALVPAGRKRATTPSLWFLNRAGCRCRPWATWTS